MSVTPSTSRTTPLAAATAVVDLGLRACQAYGREDLHQRLAAVRQSLADPRVHVVVVGEFKQGKSSLVNALVGAKVCPVADDVATALPTHVRHGDPPAAELIFDGDPPRREPLSLQELPRWVMERDPTAAVTGAGSTGGGATGTDGSERPVGVEVRVPRAVLAGGLVVVDTPGVGGLGSGYAAASLAAASMAEAVLFVTDASQELTAAEVEFLRRARQVCPTVACVITKIDFYPAWRKVRDLNQAHLRRLADGEVPVLAVSSTLRMRAVSTGDRQLNQESGFADLVAFLRDRVGRDATARLAQRAAGEVIGVCDQLQAQFEAERGALADPEAARQVVEQLNQVKARVESLRSAAARWNVTLTDGVADLTADIDHDLRARIREVIAEADRTIEEIDPADTWPQLEAWLESRVAEQMLSTYTLLKERATQLSEQVASHFAEASGQALREFPISNPAPLATSIEVDHNLDLTKMSAGKQAWVALRSAYGGAIMFVMLGALTGFTLGPLALGIGLVMGRKGLKEEKQRQLAHRRAQARAAVRRYCDQVSFVMGKDCRDTLRRIQRELRDHYTALAEELNRSHTEALRAATEAANRTQAERTKRLKDLDAELARVRELRRRAEAVTGSRAVVAP
ncbi:MAG: dynamin family protein [Micromonosporaceae bacterium]